MEQMKSKSTYTYAARLLLTGQTYGKLIPECNDYHHYFYDNLYVDPAYSPSQEVEKEIEHVIRKGIQHWLDEADQGYILIKLLRVKKQSKFAFNIGKKIVDPLYLKYFKRIPEKIPAVMCRPFIWTSVASTRDRRFINSKTFLIGETNSTRVVMKGLIPYGQDFQTICALSDLINEKADELEYTEEPSCIFFRTSRLEFCKKMECKQPSQPSVQQARIESFERLRACVITCHDKKDGRTVKITGILSEMEEDTSNKKRCALREALIEEELNELRAAIAAKDIVGVADALCDLQYVLSGAVLEFGLKDVFPAMFDEVQRSNMSKASSGEEEAKETMQKYIREDPDLLCDVHAEQKDGKYLVYRTHDRKTLKSINYSPANLHQFIK